jgi:hypothetical protein
MKKLIVFTPKYKPKSRWSICSETGGQFAPNLGGQFDRFFQSWKQNSIPTRINIPGLDAALQCE